MDHHHFVVSSLSFFSGTALCDELTVASCCWLRDSRREWNDKLIKCNDSWSSLSFSSPNGYDGDDGEVTTPRLIPMTVYDPFLAEGLAREFPLLRVLIRDVFEWLKVIVRFVIHNFRSAEKGIPTQTLAPLFVFHSILSHSQHQQFSLLSLLFFPPSIYHRDFVIIFMCVVISSFIHSFFHISTSASTTLRFSSTKDDVGLSTATRALLVAFSLPNILCKYFQSKS